MLRGIQGELFLCWLHPGARKTDRSIFACSSNLLTIDLFWSIICCVVVQSSFVLQCSWCFHAAVRLYISFWAFQTNHFMLSESLTILDIAWPLFQAVRSLVPSSYVIFLQRLRSWKSSSRFPWKRKPIRVGSEYVYSLSEQFLLPISQSSNA